MHGRLELSESDEVSYPVVHQILEVLDPVWQGATGQHILYEPAEVRWSLFLLLSSHHILHIWQQGLTHI